MTSLLKDDFVAFIASSFRVTEEDWLSERDLSGPTHRGQSNFTLYHTPTMAVRQTREAMALDPYHFSEALARVSCD